MEIDHKFNGLSAYQLKIAALVCMTIDHIAAFGFEIPWIMEHETLFRSIGRIAAPLFLFLLVQSIHHTRNKGRFILRLYLAGLAVGLFDTTINFFFGEILGYFTPGNIFFNFFYVAVFIVLIETAIRTIQAKKFLNTVLTVAALGGCLLPTVWSVPIFDSLHALLGDHASLRLTFLLSGLQNSLLPSMHAEYGIPFILLGILLYFAKDKKRQCLVFAAFCVFSLAGMFVGAINYRIQETHFYQLFGLFFERFQMPMILALPLMALYNGQRGKGRKWFFYWYYPVHRQLLHIFFHFMA